MLNELMKLSDCVVKENDDDLIEFVNKNLANIPAYFKILHRCKIIKSDI